MLQKFYFFLLFFSVSPFIKGQDIRMLTQGTATSLRGLSVVNKRIIWTSGSNGTIGRSVDSGNTWKWKIIKGFERTDFRDIEAFDETSAVVMGTGEPAYILRTSDGGETWKVVYENNSKGMFLDAMEFWNLNSGIVIGDPINNRFFILRTFDGGMHWRDIPEQNRPLADSGEACFAASGSNITKLNKAEACFVSGGSRSRLFIRNQKIDLPLLHGTDSRGANAVAIKNNKIIIIVGGDFTSKDSAIQNCCISKDVGKMWTVPVVAPHGYRSSIEYLYKKKWISCGLNGIDYSNDDGNTWEWISKEPFNVCKKSAKGNIVFFAGNDGRIAKLND